MKVCIFTMICNEQRYLDEWIEYNFNIGFDTIIFYEDWTSNIHDFSKWENEIKQNKIIVHRIPECFNEDELQEYKVQSYRRHIVWEHFNRLYRKDYDWGASIDVDEYIETDNVKNIIDNDFLEIRLHWKIYTNSGHFSDPRPGQTYSIRETYKEFNPDTKSQHVKAFINLNDDRTNLQYTELDNNPHRYLLDTTHVKYIDTPIGHYATRSLDEYINRIFFSVGQEKKAWYNKTLDYFFDVNMLDKSQYRHIYEKCKDLEIKTNDHIIT